MEERELQEKKIHEKRKNERKERKKERKTVTNEKERKFAVIRKKEKNKERLGMNGWESNSQKMWLKCEIWLWWQQTVYPQTRICFRKWKA